MNEIYWVTRLDLISGWLIAFAVISGVITFISACVYLKNKSDYEKHEWDDSKNWMDFTAKTFKSGIFCFFFFLISSILTPTTKEAMLIYGVGNTIDYVKKNNTLQQIPDKCINAIDAWVDSFTKKNLKMKIKIERYEYTPIEYRYRAYHGFSGIPYTYPFCTKWVLDKEDMNNIEMIEYVSRFLIFGQEVKFNVE